MNYENFTKELAKQAGKIILNNFDIGMKKSWKADKSPVTETDIAVNKLVIEEINKYFPEHDIKGEEESSISNNSDYLWVCDPIDGTMPFSHGAPLFTFSLALVYKGESILGLVFDPVLDRLFYAEKGKGAYLNNKKISVSSNQTGYVDIETTRLPILVKSLVEKEFNVFKYGSCTYGGILVACGELIATVYRGKFCHDVAALKIIVEEAGGKVTDIFGNEQRYDREINGAIISNKKIHKQIVDLIKINKEEDERK